MVTLPVSSLELGYNPIAVSEYIWDPPCKISILSNLICHSLFLCNNRFSFLEILQWSPGCLSILPFNEKFTQYFCPMHVFIAVLAGDVHIIAAKNMAIFLMVNEFFQ